MSESLLAAYAQAPLLDAYVVYQYLMDYWRRPCRRAYLLSADGWKAEARGRNQQEGRPSAGPATGSQSLIVARYFAAEHNRR